MTRTCLVRHAQPTLQPKPWDLYLFHLMMQFLLQSMQPRIVSRPDHTPTYLYLYYHAPGDIRVERLGEELSPDSSVWPSYVATAAASDAEMIDGWNKGLDVLLIFVRRHFRCQAAHLLISSCTEQFVLRCCHSICDRILQRLKTRL